MLQVALAGLLVILGQSAPPPPRGGNGADVLALQVALDRAGFSCGEIDGRMGDNTRAAYAAFRQSRGLPPSGDVDPAAIEHLGDVLLNPWTEYVVVDTDLAGPFIDTLPPDLMAQATLPALGYTSPWEMLAERFHASERWLRTVNQNVVLQAGTRLRVPNVEPFVVPARTGEREVTSTNGGPPEGVKVIVSAAAHTLTLVDRSQRVVFFAPVTVGGTQDPLPTGEWTVVTVFENPLFNYNPELFWDADPSHAKAQIKPGPNNPVGVIWVDLALEHYGLHGTPEPGRIGKTESHGCVRLTNWDALRVAGMVRKGTPVVFE